MAKVTQQVPHPLASIEDLGKFSRMCRHIAFRTPSPRSLACGQPCRLSCHHCRLLLKLLQPPIQPSLHRLPSAQEVPHITLMGALGTHRCYRLPNRSSSITDGRLPMQSLLLQLPQQQGPTLPIHPDRTGAGPDRPTVDIDHIEIAFSMARTVQFIQRHPSRCGREMAAEPVLRQLACALDDGGNLAQAHLHSQQQPQAPLDAAIAGMSFDQQGQDGSLYLDLRLHRGGRGCWPQRLLQRRLPFGFPTVERLARDADGLTEVADHSIAAAVGYQFAHPANSLAGCATMSLYHRFLPASYGVRFSLPYSPGSPLATLLSHTVKFFRSPCEPCLSLQIIVTGGIEARPRSVTKGLALCREGEKKLLQFVPDSG